MNKAKKLRNTCITIFVILWTCLFHYESVRYFYLQPLVNRPLPKFKFLFPPAGWIMFFNVDDHFAHAEVYGVKDGKPDLIDPHEIILTRFVGFDNIHRNILSTVLYSGNKDSFCGYMQWRFPDFDNFLVTAVHQPSATQGRFKRQRVLVYQCRKQQRDSKEIL